MRYFFFGLIFILLPFLCGYFFAKLPMEQNLYGYLKRSADANTVELAKENLSMAVEYLESKDLVKGNTSILFSVPENDLSFFYKNLSGALSELKKINDKTSQTEKSNVLIKLRETILDSGKETIVTLPDYIAYYPYQWAWIILSIAILLFGGYLVLYAIYTKKCFGETD